jgi:O-antigen biosynthesis protein
MAPSDNTAGEKLRRKLHFHIDRLRLDETLSLEGWLFHEDAEIAGMHLAIDSRRGLRRVKARTGRKRLDVYECWRFEAAERSGFGVGDVELSPEGDNRLSLSVELGSGERAAVEICRLRQADGSWTVEPLVPGCPHSLEQVRYSPDRWGGHRFLRHGSLGALLSLLHDTPKAAPQLPEPVVLLVSAYRGAPYLRPFFTSLLTNTSSPHSLVIVDNGNDDPAIISYLRGLAAAHDHITLVRVEENRGYVGAMCLAIEYAPPGRHVVVLNTDIVLPPNWLERLVAPIFEDPTIASTTPFTNAGTTASFPLTGIDNPLYLGLPVDTIDAAFARVPCEECRIEMPSGVGFCMAHNRAAIDRIGWYDRDAFGRGYGEENDWCLRARRAGFRDVLVPNLFVYHKHGGIYQEEKAALQAKSHAIVLERYPDYDSAVAEFYRADPIAPVRALLAFLIAARHGRGRRILVFDHELGGGSNLFSERLLEGFAAEGHSVVRVSWRDRDPSIRIALLAAGVDRVFRSSALEDAFALTRFLNFDEIVINQLAEMPDLGDGLGRITQFIEASGAALTIYVHDYFLLCPSLNLLNGESRYCGLPDKATCDRCAAANPYFRLEPAEHRRFSMQAWRAAMGRLVALARAVVCFSRESAALFSEVYAIAPDRIKVIPHFADHFKAPQEFAIAPRPGLRIGVIGAIHEAKGADIVASLAEAIRARGDPAVSLTVIGTNETTHDWPGVTVTGRYLPETLAEAIAGHEINLVFMPSVWPETFCYVAEEAMCLGLPLAVFEIGAPAERVRFYPKGKVLPPCSGELLLDALLRFAAERARAEESARQDAAGRPEVSVVVAAKLSQRHSGSPAIEGCIEEIDARGVRGWAASSGDDGDQLLVEAFIDGALRGLAWANKPGTDPSSAADAHRFVIEVAPPILAAEIPKLEVYATAASGRRAVLPARIRFP